MDDKREFKIDLLAGDADEDINSTDSVPPKARISTRVSSILVLFLCVAFGTMLVLLYINLNQKIQAINTRGSAGITSLSSEINNKLLELTQQFSDRQEAAQVRLADLESQLKKLNTSVSAVQNGKLDKKDLGQALDGIKKDIAPLQESIQLLNQDIAGIGKETKQLSENLIKVETGVLNNKKEISTLDAIHIDRVYFEQELKKEREFNQQNMAHASEALFSEIATLHQRISDLEKKLDRSSSQKQNTSGNAPGNTKAPSEIISVPKPGEIIEQEIK